MRRGAGYSILFVAGHDPKDCSSGIPCHSKAGPIENHREGKLFHTVRFSFTRVRFEHKIWKDRVANWEIGPLEFLADASSSVRSTQL